MKNSKFTQEQLDNFAAYVRVQQTNRWNMLDPRARQSAGMSREDWLFCIEHYEELEAASEATT